MKLFFAMITLLLGSFSYAQSCRNESTIGTSWHQARYNCEVVLNGNANNCQPYGNMWGCSCAICPNNNGVRSTRTTGTSWDQARYNCEMILKGRSNNCQPSTNNLWYCTCYY